MYIPLLALAASLFLHPVYALPDPNANANAIGPRHAHGNNHNSNNNHNNNAASSSGITSNEKEAAAATASASARTNVYNSGNQYGGASELSNKGNVVCVGNCLRSVGELECREPYVGLLYSFSFLFFFLICVSVDANDVGPYVLCEGSLLFLLRHG